MARVRPIRSCKRGEGIRAQCLRQGAAVENGGRHPCVVYHGHRVPVPDGELRTGTRWSIVKSLAALGLSAFLLAAWLVGRA